MREIAPGILVESSYPPYNVTLIQTSRGGIVVDVPPNPVHALNWLEQAQDVAGSLRYVVMTDAKRERQLATAVCNIPIIATATTMRAMAVYTEERARREFAELLSSQYPEEAATFDRLLPHAPAIAFEDGGGLDNGFNFYAEERVLRFEAIAGSAPGSLWILVSDQNILIAGDTVVDKDAVPSFAQTPDSKAWLNTMGNLAHRHTVSRIVPGRGVPEMSIGDIEPQREFMRVMRRAARTLVRRGANGLSLSQTAQELGQTFFNRQGQKAIKEIRAGLEHLVTELQAEDATKTDDD